MASLISLGAGLLASAMGVATIATMLYFTLVSLRKDRHSPGQG